MDVMLRTSLSGGRETCVAHTWAWYDGKAYAYIIIITIIIVIIIIIIIIIITVIHLTCKYQGSQ